MKRTSRHNGQLQYNSHLKEAYYPEVTVETAAHGTYTLEGRILTKEPEQAPAIMVVHGARSDFTSNDGIFVPLYRRGIDILNASLSGHGVAGHQSELHFSLDENLQEAVAFSKLLRHAECTLVGISMGGCTAVRLLQKDPTRFDKLILFYPTAFADEVYSIPFGTDAFRAAASKKGAFLTSSFFRTIRDFPGKIMLIKGEFDGLDPSAFGKPNENAVFETEIDGCPVYSPIPPEVFYQITSLRPDTEFVEIPGADHRLSQFLQDRPKETAQLLKRIYDFIVG